MHEEKAPFSGFMIALMLGSVAVLAIASIFSFAGIFSPVEAFDVMALATAIIAGASLMFFNMRFRVGDEGVEALMFPFSHLVFYDNIKEVHTIDKIPWYVGWGMRIWKRRLAFVSMHKSAVAVEKKKGIFKTLVMTTSDPEKFIEIIKNQL